MARAWYRKGKFFLRNGLWSDGAEDFSDARADADTPSDDLQDCAKTRAAACASEQRSMSIFMLSQCAHSCWTLPTSV